MKARGVALITALLVVAVASLAATALMSSAQLSIHRTAALRDSEQAWWVARGVESWVQGILLKDASESPDYDGLDEPWAQPVDYLPVDQGFLHGRLVDLQGLFNLNDLAPVSPTATPGSTPPPNPDLYREQFRRLLQAVPDLQASPDEILNAVSDWLDPDQNARFPGGAEDPEYTGVDPPYRAANRQFTVPSELLAVKGITPKIYEALAPLVTALPATGLKVNVNTAPEMVLRSLSSDINEMKLRAFLERREGKPCTDRNDPEVRDIFGADAANRWDIKSGWFQIRGEVVVGSSRVGLYSLIYREGKNPPVVLAHSADAD